MNLRRKIQTSSLLLGLVCSFNLYAEGNESEPISNEVFQALIESSPVAKDLFDKCNEQNQGGRATDLQTCLSNAWRDDLDDKQRQELADQLQSTEVTFDSEGNQVRKPRSEKIDRINVNTVTNSFSNEDDPAISALRKYLGEQLSNALYGELSKGKIEKKKFVDHEVFYTLFKSQVGQNIIVAVSDYCMSSNMHKPVRKPRQEEGKQETSQSQQNQNATPKDDEGGILAEDRFFVYGSEEEIKFNRDTNLKNLKENFGAGDATYKAKQVDYTQCVTSIPTICHQRKNVISLESKIDPTITSNELDKAQDYACVVTEYLTQARQALMNVDQIQDAIKEQAKQQTGNLDFEELRQNKFYQGGHGEGEKSIQKLSIQTSTDIKNAKLDQNSELMIAELEACEQGDQAMCDKYLKDNLDEEKKVLAEEFFKARAQEVRLKSAFKEDPEKVKEFLKEEGFGDQADTMVEEIGQEELISQIENRYREQKDAVIKSLAAKIDSKSTSETQSSDLKTKQISDIKTAITSTSKNLIDVLHFANLSSAYLTISATDPTDPNHTSSVNTVAAFSELNADSLASAGKRAPSNQGELGLYESEDLLNKNKEFLQVIEEQNQTSGFDSKASSSTFSVEMINELLLKYNNPNAAKGQ